jgi:hypothetical protein
MQFRFHPITLVCPISLARLRHSLLYREPLSDKLACLQKRDAPDFFV